MVVLQPGMVSVDTITATPLVVIVLFEQEAAWGRVKTPYWAQSR